MGWESVWLCVNVPVYRMTSSTVTLHIFHCFWSHVVYLFFDFSFLSSWALAKDITM